MTIEVRIPSLGESVSEATIARWMKQNGEYVERDEPLLELETDKAAMQVSADVAGKLEIVKAEGSVVPVGELVGRIDEKAARASGGGASPAAPAAGTAPAGAGAVGATPSRPDPAANTPIPTAPPAIAPPPRAPDATPKATHVEEGSRRSPEVQDSLRAEGGGVQGRAQTPSTFPSAPEAGGASAPMSPSLRRLAREQGVDPAQLKGSGPGGRVTKDDVDGRVNGKSGTSTPPPPPQSATPAPAKREPPRADAGKGEEGTVERVPMTSLRKRIAERLVEAQKVAAILTTFNEVDMQAVMALRKKYKEKFKEKHGVDLGFMSIFGRAVCQALGEVRAVNAQIDGNDIVYHSSVNLGIAVSAPRGLVVPVVRGAERMTLWELERAIGGLAATAREGKLMPDHLTGGTFTISNGGVFGSLMSTPILTPPQTGILGMHKIQERPVVVDGQIVIRPMMYLALSYDHRLVDGEQAVTFLVRVKERLEDPSRLLLGV